MYVEAAAVAHQVETGTRKFVRDCFEYADFVALGALACVPALDLGAEAHGERGSLDIGPSQILVAALAVAGAFLLALPPAAADGLQFLF